MPLSKTGTQTGNVSKSLRKSHDFGALRVYSVRRFGFQFALGV